MSDHPLALGLPADAVEVVSWVHEFAARQMRPVAAKHDAAETTPWEFIQAAREAGIYDADFLPSLAAHPSGLLLPAVTEELSWGDAGLALSILGSSLAWTGILANGTPEQVAAWAPRCYAAPDGSTVLAAFAASEPDAGSDVSAIRTRARLDEASGEWVLDGVKTWATNGGIADVHVIVASVDPALGSRGHAAFIVPASQTPGLRQGQKFSKMGIRASHTAEVVLEGARVPADNVLGGMDRLQARLERARTGRPSRGQAAMATFEASRPMVGAMAVGIARAALEYAVDYSTTRQTWGRPIAARQAVSFALADAAAKVDAARLLVWRASWMARNNVPFTRGEGSMSKLVAGRAAVEVTDMAIQVLGGAGYVTDHPVAQWHRDAKIFEIFEGTSEIQRAVVSRALTGIDSLH